MEKLIKIAKELNVGTSTIVEHLNRKGFEIENKPTAKVTDEMYTELLKEFQKSIAIKEKADQLVIGTRPTQQQQQSPVAKKETLSTVKGDKGGPPVVTTTPAAKEDMPANDTPAAPEERRSSPRLKILGKIDLGGRLRNRKEDNKQTPAEEPQEVKTEPIPEPPVEEPVSAPEKEAPAETPQAVEPTPAETPAPMVQEPEPEPLTAKREQPTPEPTPPVEEPTAKATETPAVATPPQEEKKEEPSSPPPPPPVQETPPAQKEPVAASPAPSEQTPPSEGAESDAVLRAEAPELRGLKIMGKIDADKLDRRTTRGRSNNKKEKEKPKTDERKDKPATAAAGTGGPASGGNNQGGNQNNDDTARKKRKRKRKKVSASPGGENKGPQTGGGRGPATGAGGGGGRRDGRRDDDNKEVSQKEIEDKIKATMARLSGGGKKKRQRMRRDNRERIRERQELREQETQNDKLQITEFISVQELANLMDVPVSDVITTCLNLGVIVSINQRLDAEVIELVANEFGHEVEFISVEEQTDDDLDFEDDPEDLEPRAPIVTVMGHVDHGKTSLLDHIREANVASGEAGGITQHIGAYEVTVGDNKKITFLDTPGHEAFTAMRARGAKVTDIAIIIIAADDSIMPQTREAISHAQAAGVPIVFAINKIDKAGANPEKIKQELASMNFLVEEWGGKYQSQDISAKTGIGIDELLEKILLEAELLELNANPDREAVGTVLEASLDKGRGYVAKILVQTGTLHIGDPIVSGEHSGKIKAMFNERNKRIKTAGPATPVLILGLSGAPQAGERFKVVENEQEARQIAGKRAQIVREQTNRATKRISLDEIGRRLALGNFKELNLIVKGDVDGSVEALADSLIKLSQETVGVNVIHQAVGQITESDVLLASASDAIIIGFQVRPSINARRLAESEGVQIKMYSIIYEAIGEIKAAIEGMLEPTKEERITAQVVVKDVFKISKVGTVAGCLVEEGRITRDAKIRIIRDGIVVFPTKEGVNGEIDSLKRFKDDVKEVRSGMECGISVKNFNDIKAGDVIEGYEIVEIKQKIT